MQVFPNEWHTFSCSHHLFKLQNNSSVLLIDSVRQGETSFGLPVLRQLGCTLRGDIQSCHRGILGLPSHLAIVGGTGGRCTLTEEYSIAMSCKLHPTSCLDIRPIRIQVENNLTDRRVSQLHEAEWSYSINLDGTGSGDRIYWYQKA